MLGSIEREAVELAWSSVMGTRRRCLLSMPRLTYDAEVEERARLIFESEGRKGFTWTLIAGEKRKPGVKIPAVLADDAEEKYRERARRELG